MGSLAAKLGITAHAYILGLACGYKVANDACGARALQAYLGHHNIQNGMRYTALGQGDFKGFWRDWGRSRRIAAPTPVRKSLEATS
jgi:hypothetical protein